jgi:hypothetical protein
MLINYSLPYLEQHYILMTAVIGLVFFGSLQAAQTEQIKVEATAVVIGVTAEAKRVVSFSPRSTSAK